MIELLDIWEKDSQQLKDKRDLMIIDYAEKLKSSEKVIKNIQENEILAPVRKIINSEIDHE